MPDQALGFAREAPRVGDPLAQRHLEHLVRVLVHEGRPAHEQLVDEDAESVPVGSAAVPHVENDLRCDVLRRPTQGVGAIPSLQALDEAEVGQFDEPIILHQHVLRFQVSIDEVLPMHILKSQHDLRCVEPDQR